jgi:hypothetical protein
MIGGSDLVYYREGGNIMSGGFQVSSISMKKGIPLHDGISIFENLAVPAGLLTMKHPERKKEYIVMDEYENVQEKGKDIDDDLYENLLKQVQISREKKTRRLRELKEKEKEQSKTKKVNPRSKKSETKI